MSRRGSRKVAETCVAPIWGLGVFWLQTRRLRAGLILCRGSGHGAELVDGVGFSRLLITDYSFLSGRSRRAFGR